MQIKVLIRRNKKGEPAAGNLKAYVIGNGGAPGPNLLKAGQRNVEDTKQIIRDHFQNQFKNAPTVAPPQLIFEIDDWQIANQEPPAEKTA